MFQVLSFQETSNVTFDSTDFRFREIIFYFMLLKYKASLSFFAIHQCKLGSPQSRWNLFLLVQAQWLKVPSHYYPVSTFLMRMIRKLHKNTVGFLGFFLFEIPVTLYVKQNSMQYSTVMHPTALYYALLCYTILCLLSTMQMADLYLSVSVIWSSTSVFREYAY